MKYPTLTANPAKDSEVSLPGPREPGLVDAGLSDRELFVAAMDDASFKDCKEVPELPLVQVCLMASASDRQCV